MESTSCSRIPPAVLRIFISYRRGPTSDITGRIHDHLETHFGTDSVFRDVDSIPLGVRFPIHLEEALEGCELVLAIIGPDWVTPRLQDPRDVLRQELEVALSKSIPIIPILVGGATVPSQSSLPESLWSILEFQATKVSSEAEFSSHMRFLIRSIERLPELEQRRQKKLQERQQAEQAQRQQAEELERLRVEAAKRREAAEIERLRAEALKALAAERQEQLRLEEERRKHAEQRAQLLAEEQELRKTIEEERQRVAALKQQQAEEHARRVAEEQRHEQAQQARARAEALQQQQAAENARRVAEEERRQQEEQERLRAEAERRAAEEQQRLAQEKRRQEAQEQERRAAVQQQAEEEARRRAQSAAAASTQPTPLISKRPGSQARTVLGRSIEPQMFSVPALFHERKGPFSRKTVRIALALLALGVIVELVRQRSPAVQAEQASASASAAESGATPVAAATAMAAASPKPCPAGMAAIPGTDQVPGFCMGRTEVSVEDYGKCVQGGTCSQPGTDEGCTWKNKDNLARHPINCVSQDDARKYCAFGRENLPTLGQWQVAAAGAATNKRKFPWGDNAPAAVLVNARGSEAKNDLGSLYDGNDGYPATAPVDAFPQGATAQLTLMHVATNAMTANGRPVLRLRRCMRRGAGW